MAAKNKEGMTLKEWLAAAGLGYSWRARQAWLSGEDPTEYRVKEEHK